MKRLNKLTTAVCSLVLVLSALTGCEGGDIFSVNAPDWISAKVDSIANSKKQSGDEEVLVGMNEDVYSFGKTDYSSGWWSAFSKYYVISDGKKWNAVFNLHINPEDNSYFKNFVLVITNDADRGSTGYQEYGAFRYDATADSTTYNSQWGTYFYFKFSNSNLLLAPIDNQDANVQKLGGKVTLTVDRSKVDTFAIKITNGTVTKTYVQPYKLPNLNADATNKNIRCFIVADGTYIDFQQSNVEPIGGYTSAKDKNPLSMVLANVPKEVVAGIPVDSVMKNVTAKVTFEEGVTKEVKATELQLQVIPDLNTPGTKTLVVIYNKTFKGLNCSRPIMANTSFEAVEQIASIKVTTPPSHTNYYYYASDATKRLTDRAMAFDPTGMVVTATTTTGSTRIVKNSELSYSAVLAKVGKQKVTITAGGATETVEVNVAQSQVTVVKNTANVVGATDNSTGFWGAFSDDFKVPMGETRSIAFTNYSNLVGNWNNYVVVLRNAAKAEYGVVRADNYGWGKGYENNPGLRVSGGQTDWAAWLKSMNGAKVIVYVTNCGNGTAEVQVVMKGTDGTTSTQYYLGISTIVVDDLYFALTVDGCHLVF